MAHVEYKGIGAKGQAKFRLYYDGLPISGKRNQIKESFSIYPQPDKASAIIKAARKRDEGIATKTELSLLQRFEAQAKELADLEARKKEQLVNDPTYVKPPEPEKPEHGELFTETSARWLTHKAGTSRNGRRAPKTISRYEQLLTRINDFFRKDFTSDIDIDRVEEFYTWLATQDKKPGNRRSPSKPEKLSKQTIWHYYRCLYAILEYAVAREKLKINPCKYVKPPSPASDRKGQRPDAYTAEQAANIKELLESQSLMFQVFVNISLEVGARPEETLALTWADIDFKAQTVDFNKVWQHVWKKGNLEIPHLKTAGSRRKNRLSAQTISLLKQLKAEQEIEAKRLGSKWEGNGVVFAGWNGQRVYPGWATHTWRKFITKTDLPAKPLYSLRHTCISLLVAAGVNPLEIAHMVGHTNAEMIWRVYGHATEKEKFEGSEIIQQIITKKRKQSELKII